MTLRCLIIDDEFLARQRLRKLLEPFLSILIVGDCKNGKDALEKIQIKEPDLIFLDIQMPDMDGFTVYEKLQRKPYVIFTTAYDTYALNAFEINAVDYLLKPFDEERLAIAVKRILDIKRTKKASLLEEKIKQLIEQNTEKESTQFLNQISLSTNGREQVIRIDDIIYFKSDGNYIQIVTSEKSYLYRKTMSSLYDKLDLNQFLRIHRTLILNKIYIKSCTYINNNVYKFKLKNDIEFLSSRSFSSQVSEYLSN
ncbi:LytTR family two component transcriptional regulator [Aquimarina sp. MAR_2010_214]|uniref:LytR/AlgR family response regulator transcription factor n=1 Tax=Aquimarina sp. MAR_2010_214 TaxID=1250026 RepID=UPI000C70B4C7|nr:response regulator [Aquimarina sp. MAR_2010_214]PKV52563.1 LytTR family two component transcriptional regulator [Aquimarina sp. MAR_2010_214]